MKAEFGKPKCVNAMFVVTLLLLFGVPAMEVQAEDEDTAASVYLVFDPDTGEFITVDDPDRSQMHAEQQEAIMSGVATDEGAASSGEPASRASGRSIALPSILAVLVASLLGGFFWLKKNRQPSA